MKKAIREVIVVEGRYDKNALSQVCLLYTSPSPRDA